MALGTEVQKKQLEGLEPTLLEALEDVRELNES